MTQADKAAGHVSALIEGANAAFNKFKTDHAREIEALNEAAAGTAAPHACAAGAPVPAQTGIEPVRLSLFDASKNLLQWIETAHRPPQHDLFGTMARVRVDALATLADAIADEELRRAALVAAGGGDASIAEETQASAGAAAAACADPFRAAARQAVMHQARADLAQSEGAPVAGSEWPAWARDLDKVAADMKQIEVATGNLFSELANILGTVGADTFDKAAAAMAAESAEKVADAERSVPARAGTVISTLVVEVDTTQLDAALAKAEQLKAVLAELRLS